MRKGYQKNMRRLLSLFVCFLILTVTMAAYALSYDELLQKAEEYVKAGDYDKAFACYDLAIKSDPGNITGYLRAGILHLENGEIPLAGVSVDAALAVDSTSADAWLLKCRIDIANGDVSAFDTDALYAEICGADLTPYAAETGALYAKNGFDAKAVEYFSMVQAETLTEEQKGLYRRSLIAEGKAAEAEELGLAASQVRNEKLDTDFETGSLKLIETESYKIRLTTADFEMTEELKSLMDEDARKAWETGLPSILESTEFRLLSKSPAGNSGIVSADGMTALSFYHGKYHVIYPYATKGVADEYSNMEKYYELCSRRINQLIGSEGVVYSPDGRFAAIYNIEYTLMRNQFFMDPILIDLSTGELFLTAAYPSNRMKEEGASAVTTAVFSADGRYFYYVLYGRFENGLVRLYRYDLNTGETEMCFETDKRIYYPCMSELSDGSLLFLEDTMERYGHESIVVAGCDNEEWTLNEYPLKLDGSYFYTRMFHHSMNSGYTCLLGGKASGSTPIVQLIDSDHGLEYLDRLILLLNDKDDIVTLTPEEYQQVLASEGEGKQSIGGFSNAFPYQTIANAVLSPDGHYLLLHTIYVSAEKGRVRNLYLVRADDLSIRKIEGLNAEEIQIGAFGRDYAVNIEWNTDELIIGTNDGIKTYAFE